MLSLPRGRSPRRRTADMVAAEALRPDDDADVYAFTQLELPELAAHAAALAAELRGELPAWGRPKVVEKAPRRGGTRDARPPEKSEDAFKRPDFPDSNALRESRSKLLTREALVGAVAFDKMVRKRAATAAKEQGKRDELKIALGQIRAAPLDILGPARRGGGRLTLDGPGADPGPGLDPSALVRSASAAIAGSISRGNNRAQVGVSLAAMQRAAVPRPKPLHELLRDDRPRPKVTHFAGRPPARLHRRRHDDASEASGRSTPRSESGDGPGGGSLGDDKTHDTMLDQIEGYKSINFDKLGKRGDVSKGATILTARDRSQRSAAANPYSPHYKLADQIEAEWPKNGRNRYFKSLIKLIKERPPPPAVLADWRDVGDRVEPDDAILARDYSLDPPHVDERFVPEEPLPDVAGERVAIKFALTEKKAKKMSQKDRRRAILDATSNSRLLHSPVVLSKEIYRVIPRWEAGRHYLQNRQKHATGVR